MGRLLPHDNVEGQPHRDQKLPPIEVPHFELNDENTYASPTSKSCGSCEPIRHVKKLSDGKLDIDAATAEPIDTMPALSGLESPVTPAVNIGSAWQRSPQAA